jgi:hypothetical protein
MLFLQIAGAKVQKFFEYRMKNGDIFVFLH